MFLCFWAALADGLERGGVFLGWVGSVVENVGSTVFPVGSTVFPVGSTVFSVGSTVLSCYGELSWGVRCLSGLESEGTPPIGLRAVIGLWLRSRVVFPCWVECRQKGAPSVKR